MNIVDTEDLFIPGELVLNSCGTESVGGISKTRTRRDFTLIYILKGRAYLTHNGVEQPVQEGQSMLFLPGCKQNYRFDSTTKNLDMWIHFAGSFCKVLDGEGARIITASSRSEWESNFHRLARTCASLEEDRELLGLAYLRVMIALLVRDEKAQRRTVSTKAQLHAIIGLIQSNLSYHHIDWDECAASCCLSRSRFNHIFKEYVGMSPEKYRTHLRMERAKFLLGDLGLSVGECADTLGFQDVSYFCRRFRKEFGMSPSEYQKKF